MVVSVAHVFKGLLPGPFRIDGQNADKITAFLFHAGSSDYPAVLTANWKALFEDRPKLGFPVWPVAVPPDVQERRILESLGQQRLANMSWQRFVNPGARLRMLVLAAVARKLRRPEAIAALVQVSIPLAKHLLDECARAAWVTWRYHLTPAGRQELQPARTVGMVSKEEGGEQQPLTLKSGFYFPKALRGAGKST